MSGKSVFVRQVALIVLMAQVGSFVPAKRARVGLADRIFTRVGARDNVAGGESTFLVEMSETSHILRHATPRSLMYWLERESNSPQLPPTHGVLGGLLPPHPPMFVHSFWLKRLWMRLWRPIRKRWPK